MKVDLKFDERGTFDKYLVGMSRDIFTHTEFKINQQTEDVTPTDSMEVYLYWDYRFDNNWGVEICAYQKFVNGQKLPMKADPYRVRIVQYLAVEESEELYPFEDDMKCKLTEKQVKTLMRKIMKRKATTNDQD